MPTSPPARTPRNNYAEPHTPIASAKRPRSMDKSMMSPAGQKGSLPASPLIPMEESEDEVIHQTPPDRSQMSPMHPAKPLVVHEEDEEGGEVGRKVDALFSPMLNFLGNKEGEEGEEDGDHDGKPPASSTQEEEEETEEYDEPKEDEATDEEEDDRHVEDDGSEESYEEDEFNPYVFIKSLPAYDLVAPLRPPIALPPKSPDAPPISLVLDLDETLVHCTVEPVDDADLVFPVDFHGMTYQVHVRLRPYLFEFLEKIKGKYEVIVFTASQKVYANELLNLIDPEGKYIHHRMYRESCLAVEGNFLKDLNVLGRDLSKSVLVDNSPHAFGYQVDNGIPIESWFDDPKDTELRKLERFLRTLHGVEDCRKVIRKTFQTYRLVDEA